MKRLLLLIAMFCAATVHAQDVKWLKQLEKQGKPQIKELKKKYHLKSIKATSFDGNAVVKYLLKDKQGHLGIADLSGKLILPIGFDDIEYLSGKTDGEKVINTYNSSITLTSLNSHEPCFLAHDAGNWYLYKPDGKIMASFPYSADATIMTVGDHLIYNFKTIRALSTKENADSLLEFTNGEPNIGVLSLNTGADVFDHHFTGLSYNIPNHVVLMSSIVNGREVMGGFDVYDKSDSIPMNYYKVKRFRARWNNKLYWFITKTKNSSVALYEPLNSEIHYVNELDSLYEHGQYLEVLNLYDKIKQDGNNIPFNDYIFGLCAVEVGNELIRPAKEELEIYNKTGKITTNPSDYKFKQAKDLIRNGCNVISNYYKQKDSLVNSLVVSSWSLYAATLSLEATKTEKNYKEAWNKYQKDLAIQAEKERRRQIAAAAIIGGILGGVSALTNNKSSSTSSSSSSLTKGSSVPKTTSSSGSSKESSSSGELVTVEKHETCGVCKGTGKMPKSRGLGENYYVDCSGCSGRGYKIRYENVRTK